METGEGVGATSYYKVILETDRKIMHPDEVTWITDNVAITNFVSAHDKHVLTEHGVKAILCLDREVLGDASLERGVESIQSCI